MLTPLLWLVAMVIAITAALINGTEVSTADWVVVAIYVVACVGYASNKYIESKNYERKNDIRN